MNRRSRRPDRRALAWLSYAPLEPAAGFEPAKTTLGRSLPSHGARANWSGWRILRSRPLAPKASALLLSYTPWRAVRESNPPRSGRQPDAVTSWLTAHAGGPAENRTPCGRIKSPLARHAAFTLPVREMVPPHGFAPRSRANQARVLLLNDEGVVGSGGVEHLAPQGLRLQRSDGTAHPDLRSPKWCCRVESNHDLRLTGAGPCR